MKNGEKKRIIVVLGMHRSGTSTVMKAIETLGVSIGDNLMPPAENNNPKGFFEDLDILNLNEEMLSAINQRWHSLSFVNEEEINYLCAKGFLEKAVQLLNTKLQHTSIYGFKEPRVSKLLGFWKLAFAKTEAEIDYIFALRHPTDVALSLKKRDGIDLKKGELLWLSYIYSSIRSIPKTWLVVSYDLIISNPHHELKRIADFLNLFLDDSAIESYTHNFIDTSLRHNHIDTSTKSTAVTFSAYEKLLNQARDTTSSELAALDSASVKNSIFLMKDVFAYIDYQSQFANTLYAELNQKNNQTEKLLRAPTAAKIPPLVELCIYFGLKNDLNAEIQYDEHFSSKQLLEPNQKISLLKFPLDKNSISRLSTLRFDMSNTCCFVYIFEIYIMSESSNKALWHWNANEKTLPWEEAADVEFIDFLTYGNSTAAAIACLTDDPQVYFTNISNKVTASNEALTFNVKLKLIPITHGLDVALDIIKKSDHQLQEKMQMEMELRIKLELEKISQKTSNAQKKLDEIINKNLKAIHDRDKIIELAKEEIESCKIEMANTLIELKKKQDILDGLNKSSLIKIAARLTSKPLNH